VFVLFGCDNASTHPNCGVPHSPFATVRKALDEVVWMCVISQNFGPIEQELCLNLEGILSLEINLK
jgi:hypothetical protein